ncbi:MAG: glycosyltransferase [Acidobacteriia bacterium]|nr:glycosyltransferase [Terriglobia bacterium]
MTEEQPHISVCICTYKRPDFLKRLLGELGGQNTNGLFTYSIVVAENDHLRSAERAVTDFAVASSVPIKYCVEPRQNIAQARNKAIMNAKGDFVAFIDDDEFPTKQWLLTLFKTLKEYKVDGVLGPVKPYFDAEAPQWVIQGGFYDRPMHRTGLLLDWSKCRTGNVLLKSQLFAEDAQPFRPEFLSGEDQDFFKRMIEKGCAFIWCNEAVVYEVVPPVRWKRSFLVRRALMKGVFSLHNHGSSPLRILESLMAVPAYAAALLVVLLLGQARFMSYVYKFCYHVGRLLALVGVNPIRQPYVTD